MLDGFQSQRASLVRAPHLHPESPRGLAHGIFKFWRLPLTQSVSNVSPRASYKSCVPCSPIKVSYRQVANILTSFRCSGYHWLPRNLRQNMPMLSISCHILSKVVMFPVMLGCSSLRPLSVQHTRDPTRPKYKSGTARLFNTRCDLQ